MRPKIRQHEQRYNRSNPLQLQGLDDERELSCSTSTIVIDVEYSLPSVLDHLDQIYTHRRHKRCIHLTHLTLLCMTCSVIFWMIYWITYDYCEQSLALKETSIICKTVFICQICIFISIGLSPILFILMVIFWMSFACSNPIDRIRRNFIGFRLEGTQWENQLDDYFKKQSNYFRYSASRKRKQLLQRNFGYIILSPYGILFDEIFLLISSNHLISNGIFIENERILKLKLNQCRRNEIVIYLPEEMIKQEVFEALRNRLRINIDTIFSLYF